MDIILKENIEKLGFKNEIVSVKNGYGRNFLIPKGLGILATESAMKVLTENLKQQTQKEEAEKRLREQEEQKQKEEEEKKEQ